MLEREELDNCENDEATLCPCDSLERIVCCAAAPFNAAAAVPFYSTELKKLLAFTLGLIVCESGKAHSPIFQVRYFRPSVCSTHRFGKGFYALQYCAVLNTRNRPASKPAKLSPACGACFSPRVCSQRAGAPQRSEVIWRSGKSLKFRGSLQAWWPLADRRRQERRRPVTTAVRHDWPGRSLRNLGRSETQSRIRWHLRNPSDKKLQPF